MLVKKILISAASILILTRIYSCGLIHAEQNDAGASFEYRDIYLAPYTKEDNRAHNLDFIEETWGIWGHNLETVLPDDASHDVFAKHGSGYNDDQFCFSSTKLYGYIVDYIHNQYLFSDSLNFAILPNDNEIVCLCAECLARGNKKGNATPAVMALIEKLAKKFPQHKFFTSYYATTSALPDSKMPENSGVLVSAMDYPITTRETKQEADFMKLLENWKSKTDRIYIWDYINNFDDYFTPFPALTTMQRRLQKYRDAGVAGVFFNGSGNDYSTFSRLKKAVLARLMYNPDQDWEPLVREYAKEYYPVAGDDIADFIIMQEKMVANNGKTLPMYEGVEKAITTYLPEKEFVDFYNKLVQHKKTAEGPEKEELEMMTDAMALTMLELKRINHDLTHTSKLKERLGRLPGKNVEYYNEGYWSIDKYLTNYEQMEQDASETVGTNLLKGVKLTPLTALDEDYQDISILTDGQLGIPSNYHNGLMISSADPALKIRIPHQPGMNKLKVWLAYNYGFHIGLPAEVYVQINGLKGKVMNPEKPQGGKGHVPLEFDIQPGNEIILVLTKDPDVKTMAIDEIQAF